MNPYLIQFLFRVQLRLKLARPLLDKPARRKLLRSVRWLRGFRCCNASLLSSALRLQDDSKEENPVNLDPRMAKLAGGVHRLDGQLMVVLDVDRVLEMAHHVKAA